MNKDEQNLNLLSIFHYVLGALTILFACIFLIYVGIGIAMVTGTIHDKDSPAAFGWFFIMIGTIAILAGWALGVLIIVTGVKLKKHTSRVFCIVIAGIECALLSPLGTVLGVFTIVVLMKESVVAMFEQKNLPIEG